MSISREETTEVGTRQWRSGGTRCESIDIPESEIDPEIEAKLDAIAAVGAAAAAGDGETPGG